MTKELYILCEKRVGLRGFEPPASPSRTARASLCATARYKKGNALLIKGISMKNAEATGLEPAISGLTGRRDNQLRYASVQWRTLTI